ncbi:adenylosuccinate lyase family protein [Streptomyces sp. NBRC 110035]|uniref:class-II fumarase/aspartase family protein n=1 Tax=Streptomyces sp. NBRC 110035 TaxID=1547867 RepID=UPI0005A82583|nr:adenylosuccinate lyase family protein [Streptomyces sp. NBRC 110035]
MSGRSAPLMDSGLLSPVRAGTPVEEAVCDQAWLQAMLDAEAALARTQAQLGTLPPHAAEVITAQARAEHLDLRALAVASRESANPVVGLVAAFTRHVASVDAAAAEYVHRGSTSQDIFDTGAMLVADRALRLMREDLHRAIDALAELAVRHRGTTMAGRTLALHAVPTTFGLKAAGWRKLLLDADRRLACVLDGGLPVSLGGAAGTMAGYLEYARLDSDGQCCVKSYPDLLIATFAEETGLAPTDLPWHALRTPIADLAAALAFAAGALGKLALDVQTLTRTEISEVAEPAVTGRGSSSAMPHKRNPVLATLIRSASLQVPALAAALTQCLLAEDERSAGAWHAEWQLLRECLRLVGGATHTTVELVEGLEVRPERMAANLALIGSQIVSERIAAVLAPKMGKTRARQALTQASHTAQQSGRPLGEILAEAPGLLGLFTAEELADLCDPTHYTGAARALVDRHLGQAHWAEK